MMSTVKEILTQSSWQRKITHMPSKIDHLSPDQISLDPENPRLSMKDRSKDQEEILEIMARRYKLEELGASITRMGYIPNDPLIGYRDKGKVYVREGNRRIATLKLLINPELAPRQKRRIWESFQAQLDRKKRTSFKTVEITVYDNREEAAVDAYIGFRHVSGVLDWQPLERARFINDLIQRHAWSYQDIAEIIGSYPRHVERHYVAFRLSEQAITEDIPGAENITFGTLVRALQAGGVADYLGVNYTGEPADNDHPIPHDRQENLAVFVELLFGTEDREPLLKDSREITKFARILQSDEAVRYAQSARHPSLERAWQKAGGEQSTVAETLARVGDDLEDIAGVISDYQNDEEIRDALVRAKRRMDSIVKLFPGI